MNITAGILAPVVHHQHGGDGGLAEICAAQFFAFWELTTVCSWALISFHQNERSLKAGFEALLITPPPATLSSIGHSSHFARTNSFDFSAISRLPDGLRSWVWVFLLIAAWAKAAQVPLQTWLPDAMEAPTPISAYLHAAAMVKAGVYLMARTVSSGWGMPSKISLLMGCMAVLTIFVALSFYFVQDDLKRLLAYSTIAHLGYVMLGIAIGGLEDPPRQILNGVHTKSQPVKADSASTILEEKTRKRLPLSSTARAARTVMISPRRRPWPATAERNSGSRV